MRQHDPAGLDEHITSPGDSTREHLIETYRKKAEHYDITSRLYPAPGYPQRAQRLRSVQALGLRPGDTVIDMACGTGLNFALLEKAVGPGGRIARGPAALSGGGRWVVLDLKVPDRAPGWLAAPVTAVVRQFASIDEWLMRR